MAALILARLVRARRDLRRSADQQRLRGLFLQAMSGEDVRTELAPYRLRARLIAEALLEVLGLVRGDEREHLVSLLASLDVPARLRARLTQGGRAGRIVAAEALSVFPDPLAAGSLRRALARTRDGELRVAILNALLDMDAGPPLKTLLAEVSIRGQADSPLHEPLIRRAVAAAPSEALELIETDPSPERRIILADALAACGDYRAVEPLVRAAAEPVLDLRIGALRALGALGHPAAASAIAKGFADPAWEVRAAACEAAGRIGLTSAGEDLTLALGDPAWWVRFRAGEALAALGEAGLAQLRTAATAELDVMRRTASLALAERGLSEAPP
jgi:HEAT repeat protein